MSNNYFLQHLSHCEIIFLDIMNTDITNIFLVCTRIRPLKCEFPLGKLNARNWTRDIMLRYLVRNWFRNHLLQKLKLSKRHEKIIPYLEISCHAKADLMIMALILHNERATQKYIVYEYYERNSTPLILIPRWSWAKIFFRSINC